MNELVSTCVLIPVHHSTSRSHASLTAPNQIERPTANCLQIQKNLKSLHFAYRLPGNLDTAR